MYNTQCNYFTFRELTNRLFHGVAITENHLNDATETIRRFVVDGGAGKIAKKLGIGIRIEEMQGFSENRIISRRFVFIDGPRKGEALSIPDIESIAVFLPFGPYEKMI